MNAPKTSGQGKNQSATSDLSIPTLTGGSGPIAQPGEDAGAIAALSQDHMAVKTSTLEDFAGEHEQVSEPTTQPPEAVMGAPVAREMTMQEMQTVLASLVNSQAQTVAMLQALARNNPVISRSDRDQFAETPMTTFELPVDGTLDNLRRPDQRVEGVDIDVIANMDHAQQLAFLEEYVVINIHDTAEEGAENPVPLWVNGRSVAIVRGQDTAVKRKYVELLLRAKPEAMRTRQTRTGDGDVKNHIDKTRSLKYPFAIVADRNPRGPAWARKIRAEA